MFLSVAIVSLLSVLTVMEDLGLQHDFVQIEETEKIASIIA
jgi:hypothetical protein